MRAAEVLRLVSGVLQDLEPDMPRRWVWEHDEKAGLSLLELLNAAVRAVVLQRPDITAVTEAVLLEPGIRQGMPDRRHGARHACAALIGLVRNMGADGETPGKGIIPVPAALLLGMAGYGTMAPEVQMYAYDKHLDPYTYYVYPAVPEQAEVWVELTYSAMPPALTATDQELPVQDTFSEALVHHMLASVLSGDNETSNLTRAQMHMQAYYQVMGIRQQVDGTLGRKGVAQ